MKHFKLPLIVTAIVLPIMIIIGIIAVSNIASAKVSNAEKTKRAQTLGTGLATTGCIAMAPFWLFAAAKLGKERRKRLKRR